MNRGCLRIALMISLWTGLAHAGANELVLELVAPPDLQPAVVCVVSQERSRVHRPPWGTPDPVGYRGSPRKVFGNPSKAERDSTSWSFATKQPPPHSASSEERCDTKRGALAQACRYLFEPADSAILFSGKKECAPTIEIPIGADQLDGTDVLCATNPLAAPDGRRVVVLGLNYGSSGARTINFLNVSGNLVHLKFVPTVIADTNLSSIGARVLGGDYRLGEYQILSGRIARIPLEPLCYVRDLDLPRVVGNDLSAVVKYDPSDGSEWKSEPTDESRRLRVSLPPAARGIHSKLTVTVTAPKLEVPLAKFLAQWSGETPPSSMSLRLSEATFYWQRPREYPFVGDETKCQESDPSEHCLECPRVRSASTGVEKDGKPISADRCSYTIVAEATFDLPEPLTFVHDRLPQWEEILSHSGQTLSGYLPAEARQFVIRIPWHEGADVFSDEISEVEIIGPSGIQHRIDPQQETAHVSLPFASYDDSITYRLYGKREFEPDTRKIAEGPIDIPDPNCTAARNTLGLFVGAGFLLGGKDLDDAPFGTIELTLRRKAPGRWVQKDDTVIYNADLEFTGSYHLAPEPYRPVHSQDFSASDDVETVPYNRFLTFGYATWLLPQWLRFGQDARFGPGLGLGLGWPVMGEHASRVGSVRPILSVSGRLRHAITRRWDIVGTYRALFLEEIYRYTADEQFSGTPTRTPDPMIRHMAEAALQGWF